MELPPARELRKRLREAKEEKETKEPIDAAYQEIVKAFLDSRQEELEVDCGPYTKFNEYSKLSPSGRQLVLKRIAQLPGYNVNVAFDKYGDRCMQVPSFVWDWPGLKDAVYNGFDWALVYIDEE